MKKMICFDMDGTIADLYNVPNWLPKLRAEDASPYEDAAPIYDMNRRVVAAVSVSGPDYRMKADQEFMIREVRRTAEDISRLMGYRG